MKNLFTDASFDYKEQHETNFGPAVLGKVAVVGEGFSRIDRVGIGRVDGLKQYINILELIAVARAVEIAVEEGWDEPLVINTDSAVATSWAKHGIREQIRTVAHEGALVYFKKMARAYPDSLDVKFVPRDNNPAGHLLAKELERCRPHELNPNAS